VTQRGGAAKRPARGRLTGPGPAAALETVMSRAYG
jgi:hypothetical protein